MFTPRLMVFAASLLGGLTGTYCLASAHPVNNYAIFMALFALVGVGVGNLVLLLCVRVYDWMKSTETEKPPAAAPSTTAD